MGCSRVAPKPELVRLASVSCSGEATRRVAIDVHGRLPGRGAYLCREGDAPIPRRECLELARRRNAFARAFRHPVDVPGEIVESVGR